MKIRGQFQPVKRTERYELRPQLPRRSSPRSMRGASSYQSNFMHSKKPGARRVCVRFNPPSFRAWRSFPTQNTNRRLLKSGPRVGESGCELALAQTRSAVGQLHRSSDLSDPFKCRWASDGGALAAIEASARLWGSGLASATVKPSNIALAAITVPTILDSIGRNLCRVGESLFMIDVRSWQSDRSPRADSGQFTETTILVRGFISATLSGPDSTRMITLPAASVIHCSAIQSSPFQTVGRKITTDSWLLDTFRVAGLLEHATAGELSFSQKQVLSPRRNPGDYAPVDTLGPEAIQKIVEAFSKHVSSDAFVIPADVQAQRLGPEPPDSFASLRKDRSSPASIRVCGIPPGAARCTGDRDRPSRILPPGTSFPFETTGRDYCRGTKREARPRRRPRLFRALEGRGYRRDFKSPRVTCQGRTNSRSRRRDCGNF